MEPLRRRSVIVDADARLKTWCQVGVLGFLEASSGPHCWLEFTHIDFWSNHKSLITEVVCVVLVLHIHTRVVSRNTVSLLAACSFVLFLLCA